jgi:hypothetical protein
MTNTLSKISPDDKLAIAEFTGEMETPGDLKDIGQDLEVTCNDYTASLPVNVNTEYRYIYKLQVIREEII